MSKLLLNHAAAHCPLLIVDEDKPLCCASEHLCIASPFYFSRPTFVLHIYFYVKRALYSFVLQIHFFILEEPDFESKWTSIVMQWSINLLCSSCPHVSWLLIITGLLFGQTLRFLLNIYYEIINSTELNYNFRCYFLFQ